MRRLVRPMSLSVIVIAHNEATHIGACLGSAKFADEWVVVDGGSTDGTAELAASAGARVIVNAQWPGFGPQKNRALDAATGDWVLSLDADERVTPELAAQICAVVHTNDPAIAGYTLPRLTSFCGEWIRHGDWYPDRVLRLFRRNSGRFTSDVVHERVVVDGSVGLLSGHLLHYSMPSLDSAIDKLNRYSSLSAQERFRAGRRGGLGRAIGHGLWAFVRSYGLKRGFLDGRRGFILAVSIAEGTYYRYVKLWLLAQYVGDVRPVAPDGQARSESAQTVR